jgi:hypothetical protein
MIDIHNDPQYLKNLHGELATLKNFLGAYFHQDVWDDYSSEEEVWDAYMGKPDIEKNREDIERTIGQIDFLLNTKTPDEIHTFLQTHADALYRERPEESVDWLKRGRDYLHRSLEK